MPKPIQHPSNVTIVPDQDQFGTVAWFPGKIATMRTTSGDGATEGVDKWTFRVDSAGLYRITVSAAVSVVSNAGTSDVVAPMITYTDAVGTGQTALQQGSTAGVTSHTLNAKDGAALTGWTGYHRPIAPSTVTVVLNSTINNTGFTKNAGALLWSACAERIGL